MKTDIIQLLKKALQSGSIGDRNQFYKACYHQYFNEIYLIALVYFKQDADSIVQDIFLKVMKAKLQQLPQNTETELSRYIFKIAHNLCRTKLRKKHPIQEPIDSFSFKIPTSRTVHQLEWTIDSAQLLQLLPQSQMIVVQYWLKGFSYKEIGNKLQLTTSAVANRILRAVQRLKAQVNQEALITRPLKTQMNPV